MPSGTHADVARGSARGRKSNMVETHGDFLVVKNGVSRVVFFDFLLKKLLFCNYRLIHRTLFSDDLSLVLTEQLKS